jgi:hypothetical protein
VLGSCAPLLGDVVSGAFGEASPGLDVEPGLTAEGTDGALGGGIASRRLPFSVEKDPGIRVIWAAVDGQGGGMIGLLKSRLAEGDSISGTMEVS